MVLMVRMHRPGLLLTASSLAILSGCSGADRNAQASVEFPELTATLEQTYGGAALSPNMLTSVGSVLVLPSGNVWVGQPRDHRITVFGANDSEPLYHVGRRGQGPGEFTWLTHLGILGDTIVAMGGERRLHHYAEDGTVLKTVQLSSVPLPPPARPAYPAAPLQDGRMLALADRTPVPPHMDTILKWAPAVIAHRDGTSPQRIATIGLPHTTFKIWEISLNIAIPGLSQLYDDFTLVSAFPNGRGVLVVDRTAAEQGGDATYGLSVFNHDGTEGWSKRIPYAPIALAPNEADDLVSGIAGARADRLGGQAAAERKVREAMGIIAPFYPPIMAAIAGNDGSVWVAERSTDTTSVRWKAWDRTGAPLGQVSIEKGLRVVAAEAGALWVVSKDADDVQYVQRYGLRCAGCEPVSRGQTP
jgi:hypothetical protein